MTIRFTKGDGKPDTLTCVREDGTQTWAPSRVGSAHDLLHYAVETTLGYRSAFFGLLAGGRDIEAFGTRDGLKDVYSDEECWAETVVGLLQWPSLAGGAFLTQDEFFSSLAQQSAASGRPTPVIAPEQLARICTDFQDLRRRWACVPPGSTLELAFG